MPLKSKTFPLSTKPLSVKIIRWEVPSKTTLLVPIFWPSTYIA